MAFFDWDGLSAGQFLGLDNFFEIATDPVFWTAMANMVIVLVFSLTVPLFIPFFAAEAIHHLDSRRLRNFFRTAMVLPVVVPSVVWILLWRNIYDPTNGLINRFVRAVFDPQFNQTWLSDPHTALGAILFIGFPFVSSTALLIFAAGLEDIPTDVYDASKLEGLTFWQRLRHIDLPFCVPQFRLIVVSSFSGIIANYTAVLLLTQGRPLNTTMVPGYYLYRAGAEQRFGLAAAVGLCLIALILVLTVLLQRYLKSDLEYEAKR
jgi:ABC-type sugar transport system permease subunit